MVRFAEIVDWNKIRDTVLFGFIAGMAITAAYRAGAEHGALRLSPPQRAWQRAGSGI